MPGWELIGSEEKKIINKIFSESNGIMFAHGFENIRNNNYFVRKFEKKVKKKLGVKYCLATTSGTMAQYIAMKALGIKSGDEVITQAFTFVATVEAIIALGAKPVITNIDETYGMCLHDLKKKINKKTKLIIPVPMLGNQIKINEINYIAKKKKILVLEDACEALGAKIYGKYVGTNSDIGVYSLDFAKTITTGEGGLIVTNKKKYYDYCKEFHDHGHKGSKKIGRANEKARISGLNLRMTELQAAVGIAQLNKLDKIVQKNQKNKKFIKLNINSKYIRYREIIDHKNELADTLIFNFKNKLKAKKFYKLYSKKYSVKILPNALYWHFAYYWKHMINKTQRRKLMKSKNLLERSIALPISLKDKNYDLKQQVKFINKLLENI